MRLSYLQKKLLLIFREPVEGSYVYPVRPQTYQDPENPDSNKPLFAEITFRALERKGLIEEYFKYPHYKTGVEAMCWSLTEKGLQFINKVKT